MLSVTIVTPSYNQGKFLEATIQSVLVQNYPCLEYLVMDGGSTDETLDILRRYERYLTWVSEPDAGQSDALNKGFQRARGEIVAWLNSDDVYLPGAIWKAVEFFERNPATAMVYGDADCIDSSGKLLAPYLTQHFDLQHLALSCFVCQPTVFMRRQALADVGWLDPRLHFTMDYDLWMRLGREYPVAYLPEKLARYRVHPAAKTFTGREQSYIEAIRTVKKYFGYVPHPWCLGLADYRINRVDQFFEKRPIKPWTQWRGLVLFLAHNLSSSAGRRHLHDHFAGRVALRWPDGWVTREFQLPLGLEAGDRFVEFHGQHLLSRNPLALDVYYNGVLWDQIVVSAHGPFVAAVELAEPALEPEQQTISLRAPILGRLPRDFRGLSFLLDDVLIVKDPDLGRPPRRAPGLRPTRDTLQDKAQRQRKLYAIRDAGEVEVGGHQCRDE